MSETSKELSEERKPRIIIYDLGMAKYQKKILRLLESRGEYFNELSEFDFNKYPKFWNINENRGDGSLLNKTFFLEIEDHLDFYNGFLSPRSSGKLLRWTHPGVFKYFNQSIKNYKKKNYNNCNGAAIVFDTRKTQYLIDQWYECALVKDCIAPEGSDRENHRQDQAILTLLIINDKRSCKNDRSFFGMKTHTDNLCARIIYYYDELHGQYYWPTSEDLEEIRQLKDMYDIEYIIYDIWNEGALEYSLENFINNSSLIERI